MDAGELERRAARAQRFAVGVTAGLAAAAIASELRKPASERTWHGRLAGLLPYDFRPPTVERFRSTWWNPEDPRLLVGTAFGVGWDVNVGRLARLAQSR